MDRDDERSGKLQEIVENLHAGYNQFELCDENPAPKEEENKISDKLPKTGSDESLKDLEIVKPGSPPSSDQASPSPAPEHLEHEPKIVSIN